MRVLHIVKTTEGAVWALWQVAELVKKGVDVHVALPDTGGIHDRWVDTGATIHIVPLDFPVHAPWRLPGVVERVRTLVDKVAPDLIHTHADWSRSQSYPTRAIRIHTAGAGGSNDLAARVIANALSGPLGQPVVVENRAAGITLGAGVANAAPDGYTLLVWGGTLWTSPLIEETPYDPVRDFAPIATLTRSPNILVVHPSLPVRSVAELIKLAKARPGELNYTSGATGASSHVAGELFKSMANADIVRIAYKGGSTEITDLLSGQVQMTFGSGTSMATHINSGKLRALASAGSRRSILFPELPTVADTLPGFGSEQLLGFFAPGKTPDAIVKRLNQETVRALDKPEARERLLKSGLEPVGGAPEQLADSIKSEIARVVKIIKNMSIKSGG